jgi:hypothetical protein
VEQRALPDRAHLTDGATSAMVDVIVAAKA